MDENILFQHNVTVNIGDLWKVLECADAEVMWPSNVWQARMSLYRAINKERLNHA
jgi:hypothetical protein